MSEKITLAVISDTIIVNKIYEIRGQKVMLDLIWLSFMELKPESSIKHLREIQIDFLLILCSKLLNRNGRL